MGKSYLMAQTLIFVILDHGRQLKIVYTRTHYILSIKASSTTIGPTDPWQQGVSQKEYLATKARRQYFLLYLISLDVLICTEILFR